MMSRVAIVSPPILPRDAVGRDVVHMGHVLRARGHEVRLFSAAWGQSQLRDERGVAIHKFLKGDPSAVLIVHHAIGWMHTVPLVSATRCRRIVRYHNITPAHFFDSYDADFATLCRKGRDQLRALIDAKCDLYMSDSAYNLQEMLELGVDPSRCAVVAPFNPLEELLACPSDAETLRDYGDGRANVLFVGRRAPHKGHRFLLEAFAVYRRHYEPNSRLILIGKGEPKQDKYTQELRHLTRRLGLQKSVAFLESVTEAELKAHYECASAFLIASEHEGFCVPLIEAMAFRVPIVAHGVAAVPHTIGDAGLVWDAPDPFLLAQSLDTVIRDRDVRAELSKRGWSRYQDGFTNQRIERAFLQALESVAA